MAINSNIEIIRAVLDSGHSVELPSTGYSMFPTLRPDDRVIIKPLGKGELPNLGQIVIYENKCALVMHRLIEIIHDASGDSLFITRGDCRTEPDNPWTYKQFVGVAISYKRIEKDYLVKLYIPSKLRYEFNRLILWMKIKLEF